MKHRAANWFKFAVGIGMERTVTVHAPHYNAAREKAIDLVEKRTDPGLWPIGWDLTLLEAKFQGKTK